MVFQILVHLTIPPNPLEKVTGTQTGRPKVKIRMKPDKTAHVRNSCITVAIILSYDDYLQFDIHFVTHVRIPYGSLLNILLTAIMSEKSCFSGIIKAKSWMLMVATTNIKPSTANTIARTRLFLPIT